MNDGQVGKKFSGKRKRGRATGLTIRLAVLGLILLGCFLFYSPRLESPVVTSTTSTTSDEWLVASNLVADSHSQEQKVAERPVFPYSVIPGGAHSSRELLDAVRREPVVAEHYAGFATSNARVIRLARDRLAYVSYRLGNHIYWTRKKVTLLSGETLLSDGEHLARTRCGNRVSNTPENPISPEEPAEKIMSTPLSPKRIDIATAPSPAAPLWPEYPAVPSLMTLHDAPSTPVSNPGGEFPPFVPVLCCGNGHHTSPSPPSSPPAPVSPLPQPLYPVAPPSVAPEPNTLVLIFFGLLFAALVTQLRAR
jgi:hypothetical protein